jgi:hypothetical protein
MKVEHIRTIEAVLLVAAAMLFFPLANGGSPKSVALGAAVAYNSPDGTPTPDRLATPVMPEAPTQVDVGRNLYYYHCMPCHGDQGQGLTDEWRQVWVQDHQNCWGRGCHSGRSDEEGFFIPRYVPPVSGSPQALNPFHTAQDLFAFLRRTQPPQRPGALSDVEYWELTAFLLHENDRLATGVEIGPGAADHPELPSGVMPGLLLIMLLLLWTRKRRKGPA